MEIEKLLVNDKNHGFVSHKHVFQALYQTIKKTKIKLLGLQVLKNTIAIRFNLLQVCPSVPVFVFAELFIPSFNALSGCFSASIWWQLTLFQF